MRIFISLICTLLVIQASAQSEEGMTESEFEKKLRKSKLFQQWDLQDDGFLSLQEWTDGIEGTYPNKDGLATYSQFMRMDMNADHFINFKELMFGLYRWMDEDSSETVTDEEWKKWKW